MNFLSPSNAQSFSRNIGPNLPDQNKISRSVPYHSPRVPHIPAATFSVGPSDSTNPSVSNNVDSNFRLNGTQNQYISNNNTDNIRSNINNRTNKNTLNQNTNQLQIYLSQQEQQYSNISNNNGNTSSNFYAITQYILQSYFKVNIDNLPSLKLVDLIVDQTYPDSLTLRKLNDSSQYQTYEYFNTISRDLDISRCPVFALSIYFVIRWSHPAQPITPRNYNDITLLDSNLINPDSGSPTYLNGKINSGEKIARSQLFEPSKRLVDIIFPWLPAFRQDMLVVDRTNYKLHSLCELFEFMARVIIQDLRYLSQNNLLLPNIVSFISKFIPDLFDQDEFKRLVNTDPQDNNLMSSNVNNGNSSYNGEMNILNFNDTNGSNNSRDRVVQLVESNFMELSKKLTIENVRLSQQVTQLKSDLNSLNSTCSQILQVQRQLLSGSYENNHNTTSASNLLNNLNNDIGNNLNNNNSNGTGGIIILDRNSINSNLLNNIVQSFDGTQRNQSPNVQQPNDQSASLAPIGPYANLGIQPGSIPLSQSQHSPQGHPQISDNLQQSEINNNKRKLLLPTSTLPISVTSPYALSPGTSARSPGAPESPYNKRFRLEDRPTPSRTALDSLLYKSVPSPKFPENVFSGSRSTSNQMMPMSFSQPSHYGDHSNDGVLPTDNLLQSSNVNIEPSKMTSQLNRNTLLPISPGTVSHAAENIKINNLNDINRAIGSMSKLNSEFSVNTAIRLNASSIQNDIENQSNINNNITSILKKKVPTVLDQINLPEKIPITNSMNKSERAPVDYDNNFGRTNGLPTKLPTITNTFKRSALAIGPPILSGSRIDPIGTARRTLNVIDDDKNALRKDKKSFSPDSKSGPNENIKYKLSRDNRTIWDLYAEWYIGINGKWSIKKLIEEYGWRRWKVSDDSHFFPTRRIIIDYIELEVDRGIRLGRFKNPNQPREDIRKILVSDLEKFRINNGLTLNSLSLYFRYLTKRENEICIFEDFKSWNVRIMTEDEKIKSCKRSHLPAALNHANKELAKTTNNQIDIRNPSNEDNLNRESNLNNIELITVSGINKITPPDVLPNDSSIVTQRKSSSNPNSESSSPLLGPVIDKEPVKPESTQRTTNNSTSIGAHKPFDLSTPSADNTTEKHTQGDNYNPGTNVTNVPEVESTHKTTSNDNNNEAKSNESNDPNVTNTAPQTNIGTESNNMN